MLLHKRLKRLKKWMLQWHAFRILWIEENTIKLDLQIVFKTNNRTKVRLTKEITFKGKPSTQSICLITFFTARKCPAQTELTRRQDNNLSNNLTDSRVITAEKLMHLA